MQFLMVRQPIRRSPADADPGRAPTPQDTPPERRLHNGPRPSAQGQPGVQVSQESRLERNRFH